MNQLLINILLLVLFINLVGCTSKFDEDENLTTKDQSLNEKLDNPPMTEPKVFTPGIICTALNERDATFTPDGKEFYFTLWTGKFGVIVYSKQTDDGWSQPQVAEFSGHNSDLEPFVSPEGNKLFFVSNRPLEVNGESKDYDIWYAEKTASGWGDAQNLGKPINTDANEFYPSVTSDGTLYFTASYDNSLGGEDIYRSIYKEGEYSEPQNLGNSINSKYGEFNAFISKDESYLVFSSFGREDDIGGGDLYISFRNEDGSWSKAKNMGDTINSPALDYCPAISPEGQSFFFSSRRSSIKEISTEKRSYTNLVELLNNPKNGATDIYWISSDIIIKIKKENL